MLVTVTLQLSANTGGVHVAVATQFASAFTFIVGCVHVTVGANGSLTVTVKEHVPIFPEGSWAEYVTV